MSELQDRTTSVLSRTYAVERELGRGGMATVYLATDLKHNRRVAVKVMHPDLAAAIGSERFLREINIEAQLQHPHIVPLLDSGEIDGLLYYVMPYVEGESLRQRLSRHGRLDVVEAMRYLRDVVDAASHAHRHGVVHRDIKPENVMLAERHASLVDFGVGKALGKSDTGEALTKMGVVVGTPAYMAPEQAIAGETADHRVDIYALGILAHEMLLGQPPFAGLTPSAQIAAKVDTAPPDIRGERPDVGADVAAIVDRCLQPDPKRRFQTADELLVALERVSTPAGGSSRASWAGATRPSRNRNILVAAAVILIGGFIAAPLVAGAREKAWARDAGLPELRRMVAVGCSQCTSPSDSAFLLGVRVRAALPDNHEVDSLWRAVATFATVRSDPPGAKVYWTGFRGDTSHWQYIGTTPIDSMPIPTSRLAVLLLAKFERPGYRTAIGPLGAMRGANAPVTLDSIAAPDSDMVRVRGAQALVSVPGRPQGEVVRYDDFLMDRHEVTNRQYKAFVAAGGYERQELWDTPFRDATGARHSWDDVARMMRDKTGRPGPASWEAGDIPAGKEDFPVSGINWYEARAYARFVGKELPTIHHWRRAAQVAFALWIAPKSNMGSTSLAPVGTFGGMSPFGTLDMAGNVAEWCVNTDGARRYILGGSYRELSYIFAETHTVDPLDRPDGYGMRLMRTLGKDGSSRVALAKLSGDAPRGFRDYSKERPVPDAVYRTYLRLYDYDRAPLNARILKTDSVDTRFIKQTVEIDAAYGPERMRVFVFLPRTGAPPYKTVVYWPGSGALDSRSSENFVVNEYLMATGRVLVVPMYKDTWERKTESVNYGVDAVYNMSGGLLGPNTYRDHSVMQVKDLRRTVDYLASRPDIETETLAYGGLSWGGRMAPIALSVEKRFKVAVLHLPGLMMAPRNPEVDELNYLPRVTQPTLILSGRFDNTFPFETAAMPFARMLGSPVKRHQVYPTHHYLPREDAIRETLDWLDKYQGKPGQSP